MEPAPFLFFSIIVPAHNEEKYIEATLEHLLALDYPKDSYEVVVVENASTDSTYEKALAFSGSFIRICKSETRGVSAARNQGLAMISPNTAWVVFLDADTFLAPPFLHEFNTWVQKPSMKKSAVGTASIQPIPASMKARAWFAFYDISHQLTKSSCSLFMVRRDALDGQRFNESQSLLEDLAFIRLMQRSGRFFFMQTKSVSTSTRRFETDGWVRLFLLYLTVGILPRSLHHRFRYKPVR